MQNTHLQVVIKDRKGKKEYNGKIYKNKVEIYKNTLFY